ncbi:ATP-binding protein [Paraflavisolibacter sp. H34]|uniref:PAS domain-containing sensor histidine kinase n=1 Tax=Huijunlia imazamoxiresistens TaxID=3127457 RepID=UPI003016570F
MDEKMDDTALYCEFFDAQPQGLLWARPVFEGQSPTPVDFEYAYCNEEGSKIFNLTPKEVVGRRLSEVPGLSSETKAIILRQMTDVYLTGERATFTVFNPFVRRYFKALRTRVRNGVLNILQDITSLMEAQRAVEDSATKLQTIINRSQTGIFTATPLRNEQGAITDFRFVLVNGAVAAYLGEKPATLAGETGSKWFPDYKTNGLFERFRDTLETGRMNRFEFHYTGGGIDAWIDMMCTSLGDEILVTFSDFTAVKQLQLQLHQSVEELQRSNASLEEFAYAASHDLQEPLRKIQYFSERLKSGLAGSLSPENARLLDRQEHAAARMKGLIDDLLAYSKVSAAPNRQQTVKLREVVGDVLHDLEASISQSGAQLHIDELPEIHGDPPQLRQLFQNLVGNALKYRRKDITPEIFVRYREVHEGDPLLRELSLSGGGPYCLIEVADNGIGFEPKNAEKIFHIFQRLHGRSEYPGTGVGLAIVQKVVANHKGAIRALGQPGKGATFQVLLPA